MLKEQEKHIPYRLKARTIGDGELRLDTCLETSEEIYTMCQISHLKNEDLYARVDLLTNEIVEREENEDENEEIDDTSMSSGAHLA